MRLPWRRHGLQGSRLTVGLALIAAMAGNARLGAAAPATCEEAHPPLGCVVLPPTATGHLPEELPPVRSCYLAKSGSYSFRNVNVVAGRTLFFVDDDYV